MGFLLGADPGAFLQGNSQLCIAWDLVVSAGGVRVRLLRAAYLIVTSFSTSPE